MYKNKQTWVVVLVAALLLGGLATMVKSHCQIPCGIYNDEARFGAIAENLTTIEKSMKLINELSGEEKPNYNQIVRWVDNKELHADDTAEIVTYYFMAQRLKPVDATDAKAYAAYVKELTLLHQLLCNSMKAKQTTDVATVEQLRGLLDEYHKVYVENRK
jgi:nickel superoxide dismutase